MNELKMIFKVLTKINCSIKNNSYYFKEKAPEAIRKRGLH